MLLAIDAGNTNVVFALMQGRQVVARWRIATDSRRTGDEYAVLFQQLMSLEDMDRSQVKGVIIATVVPRALHNLVVFSEKYLGIAPLIAGEGAASYQLAVDVDEPKSWGADRAVNAVAAASLIGGDCLIIDFGTATTFDFIDFNRSYKGGIIAPGINLSLDALVSAAAKLPRIAIEAPTSTSVLGRNTEDQMHIGVFWGYVAMIEGLVARTRNEIGRDVHVVATGGLAVLFQETTQIFDSVNVDLTLIGLAILAEQAESA